MGNMSDALTALTQHNTTIFPDKPARLLDDLTQLWSQSQPLAGIKILHNIPVTYETLVKIESLLAAGADLTLTQVKFIPNPPSADILALLDTMGVPFVANHEQVKGEFDIALDCCAEITEMPQVTITKGFVELTQSGGERFKLMNAPYPVINVDDSHLKKLEGMYGTGDSFVRAFKERTGQSIANRHFMVFGFGKVGKGIVKYLAKETPYITVIDQSVEKVAAAQKLGLDALHVSNIESIRDRAKEAFALVTATGVSQILSKLLQAKDCPQAIIANMGVDDEIGSAFSEEQKLCAGMAINFSLKHPTLMHFIDPIFYAHNVAAQLLLENHYTAGYHPFPTYLDDLVIKLWNHYNPMDLSDLRMA